MVYKLAQANEEEKKDDNEPNIKEFFLADLENPNLNDL